MKRPLDGEFARRLKELMEKKGFNIERREVSEFARSLGKKETTVHAWIKGRVPTLPSDLKLLCQYFNISADYLLFGEENNGKKPQSPSLEYVIRIKVESPTLQELFQKSDRRKKLRREEDKAKDLLLKMLTKPHQEAVLTGKPR